MVGVVVCVAAPNCRIVVQLVLLAAGANVTLAAAAAVVGELRRRQHMLPGGEQISDENKNSKTTRRWADSQSGSSACWLAGWLAGEWRGLALVRVSSLLADN